jgi:hypothetical protein
MLENPVLLKTFGSEIEAQAAASWLAASGIEARISADDAGGMIPVMQGQEGVRLMVGAERLQEARELLATFQSSPPTQVAYEARAQSKGSGPNQAIAVLVAFVVGILVTLTWQHFHEKRSGTDRYDLNRDGKADVVEIWADGYRTEMREDRNFDGQIDRWTFYTQGRIVRSEVDENFDGVVDSRWTYTNGAWLDGTWDVDSNGVPDVYLHANGPGDSKVDWRPNGTNVVMRRQLYKFGRISEEFRDSTGKGSFDVHIKYDAFENPVISNYSGLLSVPVGKAQ